MTIVWVTLRFVFVDRSLEQESRCEFHNEKMNIERKISKR